MSDRVLEGIDAARRAGWARAYAAERRVAELEAELARMVEHFDTAADYAEEWKRRAQTAETKVALFRAARTAARTTEQ